MILRTFRITRIEQPMIYMQDIDNGEEAKARNKGAGWPVKVGDLIGMDEWGKLYKGGS